jgi:hypothetical protein
MANSKEQMANGFEMANGRSGRSEVAGVVRHLNFAICYLPFEFFYR